MIYVLIDQTDFIFDISIDPIHDELLICVLFEWNLVGHAQKLLYGKYIF